MVDNLDQSFPLLQEILNSLSQSVDQPQTSISELISFLNSTLDTALSDPENEDAKANAFGALMKVIIEALSFELPMAVSNFGGFSDGCLEVFECTIDCFISMCTPRDMLWILCEVCGLTVTGEIELRRGWMVNAGIWKMQKLTGNGFIYAFLINFCRMV
ncbi:unnamed protein product [Malus baccata var. baccata]